MSESDCDLELATLLNEFCDAAEHHSAKAINSNIKGDSILGGLTETYHRVLTTAAIIKAATEKRVCGEHERGWSADKQTILNVVNELLKSKSAEPFESELFDPIRLAFVTEFQRIADSLRTEYQGMKRGSRGKQKKTYTADDRVALLYKNTPESMAWTSKRVAEALSTGESPVTAEAVRQTDSWKSNRAIQRQLREDRKCEM